MMIGTKEFVMCAVVIYMAFLILGKYTEVIKGA